MSKRILVGKALPAGYKAMMNLNGYVESTSLIKAHKHLIKIRASQINHCAFCIDMHTKEARADGETERRIYALNAWRETPFFDEKERAILALTEEITVITNDVSDETYAKAAALFDEVYLAEIVMAIVEINAWNRLGVFSHMELPAH